MSIIYIIIMIIKVHTIIYLNQIIIIVHKFEGLIKIINMHMY